MRRLCGLSDNWYEVVVNVPVKSVLQELASRARSIRRIAVRDTAGAVVGVVSPFDAIRFVHRCVFFIVVFVLLLLVFVFLAHSNAAARL